MMRLPIAAVVLLLASMARAQAPFSCDPAFEDRFRNGVIDSELRSWIVDTARRFAKTRSETFWQHLPRDLYPCVDLSCLSDEQVVAEVARQCTVDPRATLEHAAQNISLFVTSAQRTAPASPRPAPFDYLRPTPLEQPTAPAPERR